MNKNGKRGIGVALAALLLTATGAMAVEKKAMEQIGEQAAKKLVFVNELALLDQKEIALGRMAKEKSQNPRVQEFATRLVDNHEQHLNDLRTWGETKKMEIAAVDLSVPSVGTGGAGMEELEKQLEKYGERFKKEYQKARQDIARLNTLSGAEFDREFAKQVKKDQEQGIDMTKKGQKEYKTDATFAAFLLKTQVLLERQLSEVKGLEAMMKG